jgi:uncharacterized protein
MDITPAGHAAALWCGLSLLLLLLLSLLVVRQRAIHKVLVGDGGVPQLLQAVRAFGNAIEYAPAAMGGFLALAVSGASPVAVHISGALFLVGRAIHATGVSSSAGASLGRTIGMMLTWIAYVFMAATLLVLAIV